MASTRMLSYLLIGVLAVSPASGGTYYIKRNWLHECDYRGYAPGGKVREVSKIEAPQAKLAAKGIGNVLAGISNEAAIGSAVANAVGAFVEAYAKSAPQLGAALGLFSAAFGGGGTGPDDILNAVNTAIADLTMEINQAMDSMMGYVDTRVINSEKEMMENQFKAQHRRWTFCLKEETTALATACQTDAAKRLVEDRPMYAIYEDTVTAGKEFDSFQRRKMEANLVLFRNYANLVVMELVPLIDIFCADPSQTYNCKRFSTDLNTELNFMIKYAQNAVQLILKGHGDRGVCPSTVSCGPLHEVWEGWPGVHTADQFECTCVIEDSNTKQYCKVNAYLRRDGKTGINNYYYYNYPECHSNAEGCHRFAELTFWHEAERYQNENRPVVKAYWEAAVLNMIPQWKEALKKTEPGMALASKDELNSFMDQPPLSWYHYGSGYHAREEKLRSGWLSHTMNKP